MKTVIDSYTFKHILVPTQWIQCSVCGQYKSPASYRKPGEERPSRTNCEICYNLPYDEFKQAEEKYEQTKKSREYKNSQQQLETKMEYADSSISVEDMIAALQQLPANSRLIVTQEGYYAEGKLAGIFYPEKEQLIDDVQYYSIGHSSQNY